MIGEVIEFEITGANDIRAKVLIKKKFGVLRIFLKRVHAVESRFFDERSQHTLCLITTSRFRLEMLESDSLR